jgi:Glycosyl transferase family 2
VLSCAYLWEVCEALGTEHWRRRRAPGIVVGRGDRGLPMISLHVPAHNEPPEMVKDMLRTLERLDYPRYEIILIDDNTDDEALWRPVQDWCARHRVKFAHLENWPGYKSGAIRWRISSPPGQAVRCGGRAAFRPDIGSALPGAVAANVGARQPALNRGRRPGRQWGGKGMPSGWRRRTGRRAGRVRRG